MKVENPSEVTDLNCQPSRAFHFGKAFIAATAAWIVILIPAGVHVALSPPPPWSFISGWWSVMTLCAWFTGISVYVTCLVVVAPLLALLPRRSPLWRPGLAAVFGAAAAPGFLFLWLSIFRIGLMGDEAVFYVSLTFMVAGAIFAGFYAALLRRLPRTSAAASSTPYPCPIPDQTPTG